MSNAKLGLGTFFKIRTSTDPDVFTVYAEQMKISPYGAKADQLDASHQASPGGWKEYINGLKEGGDISIEIQHTPGGADESAILALIGTQQVARTVYPSGAYVQYTVNISDWQPQNPHDGKVTGSLKAKITGAPVPFAASAPTIALLPSIAGSDGSPSSGDVLTAVRGHWNGEPTSFTYQWKKDGVAIVGATGATYTVVGGDSTRVITVTVTAINSAGSASATSIGAAIS